MTHSARAWAIAAWLASACASAPAPKGPPSAKASSGVSQSAPDPQSFRRTPPRPGAHPAVQFPTPSVKSLPNGVTLMVLPKHSAVTTLSVVVREGASSLPRR